MQQEYPSLLKVLKGHKQSIMAMDLHPKCRYVASAGLDNTFMMWDVRDKGPTRRYQGHKGHIQDLKFHPNGAMIASASSDGAVKFWEVQNQTKQVTITKAHNAKIRSIAYSCDGNLLSTAGDDKLIKIWSTIDRRLQGTYKKHENWVRSCQFSPIAKSLISCDDRYVYIWDVATKKVLQQYKQHAGVIHQVKYHSLGNVAASCSHDRKIKLYDIRSQQVIQVYEGHQAAIKTIDFHPHTCHIISSSEDGQTRIWNTQKNRLQYIIKSPSNVTKFSREGDYFVTAGVQKIINLWKTGFYDSFKEKILPIQSSEMEFQRTRQKVSYEVKQGQKRATSEGEDGGNFGNDIKNKNKDGKQDGSGRTTGTGKGQFDANGEIPDPQILYNHDKQNFQSYNRQQQVQIKKSIIPLSLQRKLQQMSTQLDFITKTTQILQARVLNNGQQLRRLLEMVELGKKYDEEPNR